MKYLWYVSFHDQSCPNQVVVILRRNTLLLMQLSLHIFIAHFEVLVLNVQEDCKDKNMTLKDG